MSEIQTGELQALREDVGDIKRAMVRVAEAMERLARLEEQHKTVSDAMGRAFKFITAVEGRVRDLEIAQPVQKMTSGWVINVLWCAGGVVATVVLKKAGIF